MKNGKSKLRGRETYKVVEVFTKDDENWAKLQKSEKQFRSKEYLVKCAEIFHVPVPALDTKNDENVVEGNVDPDVQDNHDIPVPAVDTENDEKGLEETAVPIIQETDADNTPTELEGLQPHDDKTKGAFEVIQEEDAHELFEGRPNKSNDERPRRRAARKNRHNIQEMVAMGILKVNKDDIPKLPTHAWDWDAFRELVEAKYIFTVSRSLVKSITEDVSLDDSLISSGNNSSMQTPVSSSPEQSPVEPLQFDDAHYDQHQVMYTQDTPRRSLHFVGNTTNWATYDALVYIRVSDWHYRWFMIVNKVNRLRFKLFLCCSKNKKVYNYCEVSAFQLS